MTSIPLPGSADVPKAVRGRYELDPEMAALLVEVVKVLEGRPAADRFHVSTALSQVINSADSGIVEWATDYLRKLQRQDTEGRIPPPSSGRIPLPDSADVPKAVRERYEEI